jgi:hypothetical protein
VHKKGQAKLIKYTQWQKKLLIILDRLIVRVKCTYWPGSKLKMCSPGSNPFTTDQIPHRQLLNGHKWSVPHTLCNTRLTQWACGTLHTGRVDHEQLSGPVDPRNLSIGVHWKEPEKGHRKTIMLLPIQETQSMELGTQKRWWNQLCNTAKVCCSILWKWARWEHFWNHPCVTKEWSNEAWSWGIEEGTLFQSPNPSAGIQFPEQEKVWNLTVEHNPFFLSY